MKRSHILFIHHTMGGGGAERALVTFLGQFDRTRWKVSLLLLGGGPLMEEVPEDIEVIQLKSVRGDRRLPWFAAWQRVREARRLLADRHFDLTVSFLEGPASMVHSNLRGLAPYSAAWLHCDIEANRWYSWRRNAEKAYYASLDGCASVSESAAASLRKLYGVDSRVIANPVDSVSIRKERAGAVKGNGFRVAFVGRLVEVKRPDSFLKALALLREQGIDARGVIIGEGEMESDLKTLSLRLGLNDYLEWCGFRRDRFKLMATCHALCISSRSEGRSLVAEEAAALGLPVVSTPVGGIAGRLGLWCVPVGFDARSIAMGLEKVARGEWVEPSEAFIAPGIRPMEEFLESIFEN